MLKGLLYYNKNHSLINEWFINHLIETSNKYDISLELRIIEDNDYDNINDYDFAIVRSINPLVNLKLEDYNIKVFNSYDVSSLCNDKSKLHLFAVEHNIPTMNTYSNNDEITHFPIIMKSVNGHGGTEVFMVNSFDEIKIILKHYPNVSFIYQEPCDTLGLDVRAYIVNNKVVGAVKRFNPTSFKSNYSLGGTVTKFELEKEQIDIINKITSVLNIDFIGIDFIYHNGHWILNEMEDPVGCRMLYKTSDIDIVDIYIKYIKESMSNE